MFKCIFTKLICYDRIGHHYCCFFPYSVYLWTLTRKNDLLLFSFTCQLTQQLLSLIAPTWLGLRFFFRSRDWYLCVDDHRHRNALLGLSNRNYTCWHQKTKLDYLSHWPMLVPIEKKCQAEVQTLMQLQELRWFSLLQLLQYTIYLYAYHNTDDHKILMEKS